MSINRKATPHLIEPKGEGSSADASASRCGAPTDIGCECGSKLPIVLYHGRALMTTVEDICDITGLTREEVEGLR